jgi:hypothetical protein
MADLRGRRQLGRGFGGLRTSEGEIRQATAVCLRQEDEIGSPIQLQCLLGVITQHVAEMAALLKQGRQNLSAHELAVLPATEQGASFKNLRATQLAFVEGEKKWLAALDKLLTDPNRGWYLILEGVQNYIRNAQYLLNDIAKKEPSPELTALLVSAKAATRDSITTIFVPLIDASLVELKAARAIAAINSQVLAKTAETARDRTVLLDRELRSFLDYLRSEDRGGLMDGVARFLFGATPGKSIATFVVGTALAVGAVVGMITLVRWSVRKRHTEVA